jgi:hypothetical protein
MYLYKNNIRNRYAQIALYLCIWSYNLDEICQNSKLAYSKKFIKTLKSFENKYNIPY